MNLKMSPVAASVIFAAATAVLMSIVTILPLRPILRTTALNAAIFLCLAAYSALSPGRAAEACDPSLPRFLCWQP